MMKLAVMIPAYNEKGNLEELTQRLIKVLEKYDLEYYFVFVIQGTDGCFESMQQIKKEVQVPIILKYFKKGIGVGPAHYAGFRTVTKDTDYVLTMDADLNHCPEDFDKFYSK